MLGIGLPELIVIFAICLFVFDAKQLPKIARSLGKAFKEFKDAQKTVIEDDSSKLAG